MSVMVCLNIDHLQPVWIIVIGCIIQAFIGAYLLGKKKFKYQKTKEIEMEENRIWNEKIEQIQNNTENKSYRTQIQAQSLWPPPKFPYTLNPKFSEDEYKNHCHKITFIVIKYCVLIWQLASILAIFVLDLVKFVGYVSSSNSIWKNYQCYAEILIYSSNTKTIGIILFIALYDIIMHNVFEPE
eukprot:238787_1